MQKTTNTKNSDEATKNSILDKDEYIEGLLLSRKKSMLRVADDFSFTIDFASDYRSSKYLRDYLVSSLDILGLADIWKSRFILIVDELVNNSIEYGSKTDDRNIFRFTSKNKSGKILINIEIEDRGNGEKPKNAQQMEELRKQRENIKNSEHSSIRGRGLFLIINKLVDELYFKDAKGGGLIVGVKKEIFI